MGYPNYSLTVSRLKPFKPSRCIKASFHIHENRLNIPTIKGFKTKISMKLVYQYMVIFFNFLITSNHLHPLQVENRDSNSRLVMDVDDYHGKFRLETVLISINSPLVHRSSLGKVSRGTCSYIELYFCDTLGHTA